VFQVAVQTQALHGDDPQYLWQSTSIAVRRQSDTPFQQSLRSTSDPVLVPAVKLSTVGRRAFPVAGACIYRAYRPMYMERFTVGRYPLTVTI